MIEWSPICRKLKAPLSYRLADAATAALPSLKEGRNHEIFMAGLALSRLGLSPSEIATELNAVVGKEPHMRKKIPGVIKSLGR